MNKPRIPCLFLLDLCIILVSMNVHCMLIMERNALVIYLCEGTINLSNERNFMYNNDGKYYYIRIIREFKIKKISLKLTQMINIVMLVR